MEIIHKHFESLPSTNDFAKEFLKKLKRDELLLVTASEQTAARGQYGRRWFSPKKANLYATFAFLVDSQKEPLFFTQLLAKASLQALKEFDVAASIKWPNDLLVNQKKIAGILCETEPFLTHFGIVIGLGLNVNMTREQLNTIDQPATSLFAETGKLYALQDILDSVQEHFLCSLVQNRF